MGIVEEHVFSPSSEVSTSLSVAAVSVKSRPWLKNQCIKSLHLYLKNVIDKPNCERPAPSSRYVTNPSKWKVQVLCEEAASSVFVPPREML